MTLTIDQTLLALDHRLTPLLTMADITDGIYESYHDAISTALLEQGHTVANISAPTDSELTAVTNVPHFLDLAELRVMETALNRLLPKVDTSFADRSYSYSQAANGLERAIARKREQLRKVYGLPVTATGSIGVRRLKRNTDTDDE